jgi:hypothetical protein
MNNNKKYREYKTLHEKISRWDKRGSTIKEELLKVDDLVKKSLRKLKNIK